VPVAIAANIGCAMLAGLHAAHEARDRQGRTLGIVHRDVSPQNVLVGVDGVTRIMDFGIAKASHRLNATHDRQLKGKLCYMAPEQFQNTGVDRRTDVFATAVVLWGMLAGRRLFRGGDVTETMTEVLRCDVPALAPIRGDVPPELEAAIRGALDPDREGRPATAEIFAAAIEAATPAASNRAVAEWVSQLAGSTVTERDAVIVDIEKTNSAMAFPIASGSAAQSPGNLATADITGSKAVTADWVRDAHGEATPQPTLETTTRVEGRRDAVTVVAGPTDGGAIRATVEPRKATRSRIAWGLGVLALAAAGTVALVMGRDSTPGGTETISPTTGAEPSVVASESVSPSVPSSLPNVTSAAAASATPSSSAAAIAAPTPDRGTGASRPARPPPPAASAKAPPPGPRGPYYPPSPFPK
jgi:serine/threonine-protein kinase